EKVACSRNPKRQRTAALQDLSASRGLTTVRQRLGVRQCCAAFATRQHLEENSKHQTPSSRETSSFNNQSPSGGEHPRKNSKHQTPSSRETSSFNNQAKPAASAQSPSAPSALIQSGTALPHSKTWRRHDDSRQRGRNPV